MKLSLTLLIVIAFSASVAMAQLPEVKPPPEPKGTATLQSEDETISAKVKDAITSDPALKEMEFTVATADAVVTLEGTAPARDQIARAVAIARGVPGVKSVINILAV